MARKLRMGMVGGGRDTFIGAVHQMAARIDGKIDLVAGAFSADAERGWLSSEDLGLDPKRVYPEHSRNCCPNEIVLSIIDARIARKVPLLLIVTGALRLLIAGLSTVATDLAVFTSS